MYASKSDVDGVIELLLNMNADPNLRDHLGYNALDYALKKQNGEDKGSSDFV